MLHLKSESGRSLLETLAVLAILGLITLGGIKGFDVLTTGASSKNILNRVLDAAITRSHEFLNLSGRAPKTARRVTFDNAPVPLSVENGVDGTFESLFWVTIGEGQVTVPFKTCEQLLKEKETLQRGQLPLVDISVNGTMTANCTESNIMSFFFKKNSKSTATSSSISVTPKITHDNGTTTDCPKITCPNHATCSGDTVTCVKGYYKTGCNTCNPSCVACNDGTYQANDTSDCDTICQACGSAQASINNHTACRDLSRGTPCPGGGYAGGPGDASCYDCLENEHCNPGNLCDEETHTCNPAGSGDTSNCPEGQRADGSGNCVVCRDNNDCAVCKKCSEDNMSCEQVISESDGHTPISNLCDENGNKVGSGCTGDYNGTDESGRCTADTPKCNENHVCIACPNNTPIWDLSSSTCICPSNATCSDQDGSITCNAGYYLKDNSCQPCSDGSFSAAGANQCTSCGDGTSNTAHTACQCNDNAVKNSDGTCHICPAGSEKASNGLNCVPCENNTISVAGGKCVDCYNGVVVEDSNHTACTCFTNATKNMNSDTAICTCNEGYFSVGETCAKRCTTYHDCEDGFYCLCEQDSSCPNNSGRCEFCHAGYELKNGVCSACTGNTISKARGQCLDCGAGTANDNHTDCVCYTNATHNADTLLCSCPSGQSPDTDQKQCVCSAGYTLTTTDGNCGQCAPNYYKDSIGNQECTPCPTTQITNEHGKTSVEACYCPDNRWNGSSCEDHELCGPGYTLDANSQCGFCAQGTYKESYGNQACTLCPSGLTTDGAGKTSINDCYCPAGYGLVNGVCSPCTDNTISKANGQCVDCGAGTANSDHTDCNCYTRATHGANLLCTCNGFVALGYDPPRCYPCNYDRFSPMTSSAECAKCNIRFYDAWAGEPNKGLCVCSHSSCSDNFNY